MSFKRPSWMYLCFFCFIFQINAFELNDLRLGVSYQTGRFIRIDRDYLDFNVFLPVEIKDLDVFIDLDGYRFNDGKWGASTGIGIRKELSDGCVLGLNTYYDYLRGRGRFSFHQVGVGFEMLSDCFDVRINGYLPVSEKVHSHQCLSFHYSGTDFHASRCKLEYAYGGLDAEIGKPLLTYYDFDLYGAVGPYYFYRRNFKHFCGGYARLEVDWKSILSVGVQASYDKFNAIRLQGIFAVSIPLDFCKIGAICEDSSLFLQNVRRNGVILTDHCWDWEWNW